MESNKKDNSGCGCLYEIGVVIAAILSWNMNHSWILAIISGLLSWFYLIYYFMVYVLGIVNIFITILVILILILCLFKYEEYKWKKRNNNG